MTDYLDRKVDFDDSNTASIWDELSYWSSHFGALLFKHLDPAGGITILDLACGAGFPLFELAHTHGDSCRLLGVDPWSAALHRAAVKLRTYGLKNVHLIRADGARLPLPDGCCDLIVSNLGLNNFENPRAVLAACYRVARPQARIVLTTNIKGHMREFYDVYQELLAGNAAYLDKLVAHEDHRGTVDSVCALVGDAGFQISKVVVDRFYLRFVDGSAMLRHNLVVVGFLDAWRSVVDPGEERAIFAALEERLNQLALQEGELKLTIPMLYVEGRRD